MMRRQPKLRKEQQGLLLSQEAAPILSDDLSDKTDDLQTSKSKKGGGWRSLLFGSSNNNGSSNNSNSNHYANRSTGRAVSAGRSSSRKAGRKASAPVSRGLQQGPTPDLVQVSSSSSSGPERERPSRPSAPLRTRPEHRDEQSQKRQPVPAPTPAPVPETAPVAPSSAFLPEQSTKAIQQTLSKQTQTRQLTKSASQSSEKSDRPKLLPSQSRSPVAPTGAVARVLKRPFGREAARLQDQMWIVQIAPAEWEGEEAIWKYRINIQKRVQSGRDESIQDLTNGMTFRSLADFYWLEQALQAEFHGALLIPSLSISLGVPDIESCQHEVDARLLTNWLSDVLNGVRGQGEWLLISVASGSFPVDWQSCEAMEAFMYRADLQPIGDLAMSPDGKSPTGSTIHLKWDEEQGGIFKWVMNGDMCGLTNACAPPNGQGPPVLAPPKPKKINLPLDRQLVSSKALADARSLNIQDSFVEPTLTFEHLSTQVHSKYADLMQAEKELIWNWRTRALSVMEKLRIVENEEKHIAAAWKRFAISISNLFSYEKEVESARIGETKARADLQMPYRKLQKSTVDDVLRIMAKQKVERCTPSLDLLSMMLSAYVADLSSVEPAVQSYLEALQQLAEQLESVRIQQEQKRLEQISSATLADQIQAGLDQVKKQLVTTGDEESAEKKRATNRLQQEEMRLQTMEQRLRGNEAMLQEYLTRLCKTVPVRTARMASGYIQVETKQAAAMHAAAINMKTRISVASKETLSKMIHRHSAEIKEDRIAELQIVQRMVNLGSVKKFSKGDDGTEEVERGVEINKDVENRKGELRDQAMELCRARIGRWDSKLAMAIMEAVGVHDANVRVEETTRDLRMVRKYAIGLREHVQRCIEALEVLRISVLQGGFGDIRDLRHDLMSEMQLLFSGTYQPSEQPKTPLNVKTLIEHGIQLNDPLGWRRKEDGCGGAATAYTDVRESSTEWLLNCLGELLKEYFQRVESVESFVYMECVGIQLEKHFSQQRAAALAAFEKKTDITSAINIATRKRLPVLVKELQAKLEAVGADVSHTTVKEAKEAHLESKTLKQELHDLSMRQLARARETATERAIALMTLWSKEEENASTMELDALKDFAQTIELSISTDELNPYLEVSPRIPY